MSVTLENVQPQETQESQEPEEPQEPQESQESQEPQDVKEEETIQPKRRGRPKKTTPVAAPVEAPVAPKRAVRMSKPKSDDEEPIDRDDMETMLMHYLLQRKHAQQNARRTMWAQMAGLNPM